MNPKSMIAGLVVLVIFIGLATFGFNNHRKVNALEQKVSTEKNINADNKKRIAELEKQNKDANYKLHYANSNTQDHVKKAAIDFLQAFFTYDTGKGERGWTKVKKFTTENGLNSVKPAGEDVSQVAPTEKDKTIVMKYKDSEIYINSIIDNPNKSNAFAIVKYSTTVNGTTSDGEMMFKLDLVNQNGTWLVDKLLPLPLQEK
ncbi:hypothetical protein [Bacillus pseudomycoides]|uniref:hypothetical protein n=1 Tax=Bacillus pseudomycoides TaxID=64104 RepID=UPI000BF00A62|nr:hypothetical protein [Bacillus pseudomycoides]PEK34105.1 hypothetical protein CN691_12875 [Bacillus pseudomycoides]